MSLLLDEAKRFAPTTRPGPQDAWEGTVAESYACGVCGKRYQHKRSLWRHSKFECRKIPHFQCPFCPRRTTQNNSLKKHIMLCHQVL
ncbi:hypothetical protein PR048_000162 [Dryococelus australis]|uniref:C2H2-type domain-containing protein n=1 Tax=Dryococelus australis TaxID=614101 RepID=A0ABQ9IDW0_9NEOP|nr:hypothetical protein PR048_000162 [Dryococelus australis]